MLRPGAGGRYACSCKELFGEKFGAFQSRCGARRTDDVEAATSEMIHNTRDQRSFGTDDREIDLMRFGDIGVAGNVVRRRNARGDLRDARIAGTRDDCIDARRLRETPGKRMFAASAAHN